MINSNDLASIHEALELLKWADVFKAVLDYTGDEQQAIEAAQYCCELSYLEVSNA